MSEYYGTLQSDKGRSTRVGHKYITASAQTFAGSLSVYIAKDESGDFDVIISSASNSTDNPLDTLFSGKLSVLVDRGRKGKSLRFENTETIRAAWPERLIITSRGD